MIRIHFLRSNDMAGFVIRLFTRSKWNHVAIEYNGIIWESMAPGGVRKILAKGYPERWDDHETIELPTSNVLDICDFLDGEVGKKYDWKAVFAWPFRIDWHDRSKWFCSELVAEALQLNNHTKLKLNKRARRITPEYLYKQLKK